MMTTTDSTHVFEKAGLGKPPFRFVRTDRKVGPLRYVTKDGITVEIGAPGQPMSSCDYCGQGIAIECWIRSADGREFKVGCDCVAKTGDSGLRRSVDAAKRKMDAERRDARAEKVKTSVESSLADETIRAALAAKPHPRGFVDRETGRPLTMLDWAEWMLANSGAAGRSKIAKAIEGLNRE